MAQVPPDPRFDTQWNRSELDGARARYIGTPWGEMALYLVGDEVLCAQAFCPHLEGPLFEGSRCDQTITCPWHQWRFDLRTGRRVDLAGRLLGHAERLARCTVHIAVDGRIWLGPPLQDS